MTRCFLSAALFSLVCVAHAQEVCRFEKWQVYNGVQLLKEPQTGSYVFVVRHAKVDADGAPNAYHPDDVGLNCIRDTGFRGLDCPANGGYPSQDWWRSAIVPDPHNKNVGYIQPSGEFKGFFVSQTSLKDAQKSDLDPTKYVNAATVPYLVFPGKFNRLSGTGTLGDAGYAFNLDNGKVSPFIVAEIGPSDATLGEMSIALGTALGATIRTREPVRGLPKATWCLSFSRGPKHRHRGPSHRQNSNRKQ